MKNGTIEGFFGRHWTHIDRLAHCDFLKQLGCDFYIYAPKSDHYLRKSWHQDWSDKEWLDLQHLSNHCRSIGLDFGIGFSPFELHLCFDSTSKHKLDKKIQRINQLDPDILCILFDDMRGDMTNLAEVQVAIVDQIRARSSARHYVICPSYYSEDPTLDKVFGQRPSNYLEDLGQLLPIDIDIFWTGAKVCSNSFADKDIKLITKKLQRKPFLWDNYPVNDGSKMCQHLHLKAFSGRNNLNKSNIAGHAVNPMNQAWLSRIAMASLPELYSGTVITTSMAIRRLCSPELANRLESDLELFHTQGLLNISENKRKELINTYKSLKPSPYALEVIDWLEGKYKFDPSCLTD